MICPAGPGPAVGLPLVAPLPVVQLLSRYSACRRLLLDAAAAADRRGVVVLSFKDETPIGAVPGVQK